MARKYSRKFRRIKNESQNSKWFLEIKEWFSDVRVRCAIGIIAIVVLIAGVYFYNKYSRYESYKVVDSIKTDSGAGSKYEAYEKFVVKYSSDGISYIDGKETVWDEAYEMKSPLIDVCGSYLAICDKNTNDIFLYNKKGRCGGITTSYPIVKFEVAKQGVIAALLEDKNANFIEVYDKEGKQLVFHKTLVDQNGYPIDFSLSDDGTKMMVSYLAVRNGMLSNKVMFYNFSKAGKNSPERMVGQFDNYKENIVPTVNFVTNNDAIAVGENILSVYKMKNKPELKEEINFNDEIHKVFYDENYIGLVFDNDNSKNPYRLEVYKMNGKRVMKTEIDMDFDVIKFAGKNVLMYNDMNCRIISLKGIKKFEHTFKQEINGIIPVDNSKTYLLMTNSTIEKIRLK